MTDLHSSVGKRPVTAGIPLAGVQEEVGVHVPAARAYHHLLLLQNNNHKTIHGGHDMGKIDAIRQREA